MTTLTGNQHADSSTQMETLVPKDHPLRQVRANLDVSLHNLRHWLSLTCGPTPTHPIAPDAVVRALVLKALYHVPSDREIIDRIWMTPLFRWFVGIPYGADAWDSVAFARCAKRLLDHHVVRELVARVLNTASALPHTQGSTGRFGPRSGGLPIAGSIRRL